MTEAMTLEANGLLDAAVPPMDDLFFSEFRPLGQKDLNLLSPLNSQSEAQSALNAFGSQDATKMARNRRQYAAVERGSSMDLDGDLDLDQLLDEELEVQRAQPHPAEASEQHDDHDELEAFLDAEQEMMAETQKQHQQASPPQDLLLPSQLTSFPKRSDLLESNGLLGSLSPPLRNSSATFASKNSNTASPESAVRSSIDQTPPPVHAPADAVSAWLSQDLRHPDGAESLLESAQRGSGPSRPSRANRCDAVPKYIPAGFVAATTMDGKRVQFQRRKRMKGWKPPAVMNDVDASQLLSRPIHQLLDAVEALKALDVVEREERSSSRANSFSTAKSTPREGRMWVDKHRPTKFTELLGDERVHREVLGWLKEWDECVFKRKNHRKERHQQYIQAKYGLPDPSSLPGKAAWKDPYGRPNERILMISGPPGLGKTTLAHVIGNQAGYNVYELNASDARSAGAVEDVIKTALESGSLRDPRPTLVVIDEIDGATGGGGGATGESVGFIRALVRLIEMGKGSVNKMSGLGAKGKTKKHQAFKPLLRPIICICNDLYAPALRPLRPLAKLIRFNKPPTNLVVKRLREVCQLEDLSVDARGLSLLSELTNSDIRSCLNALEFAKTKDIALTEAAIRSAAIGIKDTGSTVHKAWEVLFRRQTRKQQVASSMKGANVKTADHDAAAPWNSSRKASSSSSSVEVTTTRGGAEKQKEFATLVDTPQENVNRIVHEVIACNEYDKLAQGCFEHYPSLRAPDDGWKRYQQVHDWLHFGQSIQQRAWSHSNFELLAFMPWSFVCWHLLFAHVGNPLPEYPKIDYENHLKLTAFNEITTQIIGSLPDNVRSQFNRQSIITELGPYLMRILTPDLRPINNQLGKAEDRQILSSLVSIMTSLNIRFVQDRISDEEAASSGHAPGQLVYKLDPPLDIFTQFEGKRSKEIGPSRFVVRQMVDKEMERLATRSKVTGGGGVDPTDGGEAESTASKTMAVYRSNSGLLSANKNADAKDKNNTKKAAVDFFGRPIVQKSASVPAIPSVPIPDGMTKPSKRKFDDLARSKSTNTNASAPHLTLLDNYDASMEANLPFDEPAEEPIKVFYRFHEGFSNAVRRPMKMSSLL